MTKSKIIMYGFIILLSFFTVPCLASDNNSSAIKGKFVFDSNRYEFLDTFIVENGKTKLLYKKASGPVWSSDGKLIACTYFDEDSRRGGILIIDSQGNKKDFIEIPEWLNIPNNFAWSPDDKKIYFRCGMHGTLNENEVYRYDFSSKTHTKILEISFDISSFSLSPKGDKLLVSYANQSTREWGTYLFTSDGVGIKIIGNFKGRRGVWYPDNEHIFYLTNLKEDGTQYAKESWGYFFRMNVNTGEVEQLFPCNMLVLDLKISRDGKYFYYISGNPAGGRMIYVSPIDDPDQRIQITQPVITPPPNNSLSQDNRPDWYQD